MRFICCWYRLSASVDGVSVVWFWEASAKKEGWAPKKEVIQVVIILSLSSESWLPFPTLHAKKKYGFETCALVQKINRHFFPQFLALNWSLLKVLFFGGSLFRIRHDSCNHVTYMTRWWFEIFFFLTPTWERFPLWLIFFNWVETTN